MAAIRASSVIVANRYLIFSTPFAVGGLVVAGYVAGVCCANLLHGRGEGFGSP